MNFLGLCQLFLRTRFLRQGLRPRQLSLIDPIGRIKFYRGQILLKKQRKTTHGEDLNLPKWYEIWWTLNFQDSSTPDIPQLFIFFKEYPFKQFRGIVQGSLSQENTTSHTFTEFQVFCHGNLRVPTHVSPNEPRFRGYWLGFVNASQVILVRSQHSSGRRNFICSKMRGTKLGTLKKIPCSN